jgi:hypothetical protein
MHRILALSLAALILLQAGNDANAEQLVAEFNGSGNRTTAEFKVTGPWILDWRINSNYSHMLSFDLDLVEARTGVLKGVVLRRKTLGNGVRLFNDSGTYKFRINGSFIDWHLKVKKLTPAEAELYTPRSPR